MLERPFDPSTLVRELRHKNLADFFNRVDGFIIQNGVFCQTNFALDESNLEIDATPFNDFFLLQHDATLLNLVPREMFCLTCRELLDTNRSPETSTFQAAFPV